MVSVLFYLHQIDASILLEILMLPSVSRLVTFFLLHTPNIFIYHMLFMQYWSGINSKPLRNLRRLLNLTNEINYLQQ